jgi:hypothetical protein
MIFIQLILAHLFGDFILQPNSWVAERKTKTEKQIFVPSCSHSHHSKFYFSLEYSTLVGSLLVGFSHFIIDAAKLSFQTIKTKKDGFLSIRLCILP